MQSLRKGAEMNEPIKTITVSREQDYILTALQNASTRLRGLLKSIASEAAESLAYPNLDTMFLVGNTDRLRGLASEVEAFRDVARWVDCTTENVRAATAEEYVRFTHETTA